MTKVKLSGNAIWRGFTDEVETLKFSISPLEQIQIGLHTYEIDFPGGAHMRMHLRVESDGSGVLFVDVTDVIHLNKSALQITKMALDSVPQEVAYRKLVNVYLAVDSSDIMAEVSNIYGMVDQFRNPSGDCPTCLLDGSLDKSPLFSLPVSAPFKVDLALTYGCNNECPHCYNETDRLNMPSLPLAQWQTILDILADKGIPHLILTGGEATLHPDLTKIISYADGLGMIVGLNTNGRHIAHSRYMDELADAGLNHIQVTLGSNNRDAHNEMMGANSFDQTIRGIENAVASNVHVITNTTLMKTNMHQAEEIIDFIDALGVQTFAMNGMIYSGGGFDHPTAIREEEMPALLTRVKLHADQLGMRFLWYTPTEYCRMSPVELEIGAKRCNAAEYSMCIEPNGDVLPCQSYYVSAGNILHDPWDEIWGGELFRSFRDRELDPAWAGLPEKCYECPDLPLCGGGCRIEREARDGVRVSESGGGGCSGCSGSCGTGASSSMVKSHTHTAGFIPEGGFVPFGSQVSVKLRSGGDKQIISIDEN